MRSEWLIPVPALITWTSPGEDVSDIAGTVFMGDHALANISDNLDVRVRVAAETGIGRDFVIVPDDESAERAIRGVALRGHDEVVARLEPAVIAAIQSIPWS